MIVEVDFLDHWKTQMLTQMLGDERAPIYLIRLWGHCQNRKTHRFPMGSKKLLAAVCKVPMDAKYTPEEFHDALLECGFVDEAGAELVVHDWEVTNSSLIASWKNGGKGGRPKKKNPRETHGKPTGLPKDESGLPTGKPIEKIEKIEKREHSAQAREGSLLAHLETFQAIHPECERVSEQSFVEAYASCRLTAKDGSVINPPIERVLEEFRMDKADLVTFGKSGPVSSLRGYMRNAAERELQDYEQSAGAKKIKRHPALDM